MSVWNEILGHSQQVTMFQHALAKQRLAHTHLFFGPEGIGKKLFAFTLARCLFCQKYDDDELNCCNECPPCRQMLAGTYPDYIEISRPEGKAELPLELFLGAKDRRGKEGLCHDLSLRPMSGNRKIALIDDADLLNIASANALLKTLEEPSSHALIILVATNEDRLLPTIRSRCQQTRFQALSDDDLVKLMLDQSISENEAEARSLASMSGGSLAIAGRLQNPELQAIRKQLYGVLSKSKIDACLMRSKIWSAIEDAGADSQSQREIASWTVQFAIEFFRVILRSLSGVETTASKEGAGLIQRIDSTCDNNFDVLEQLIDDCLLTLTQIDARVTLSLCLEGWFDRLAAGYRQFRLLSGEPSRP